MNATFPVESGPVESGVPRHAVAASSRAVNGGSYARFNPGRKPEFRLFTTCELLEGESYFCKRAESDRARPFLRQHLESYAQITAAGVPFVVNPPVEFGPNKLGFLESRGRSLESEAMSALRAWNRDSFLRQFERYFEFIELLPRVTTKVTPEFEAIFGTQIVGEQSCSVVGFVDLGLDHIYLDGETRSIIDYEWTFPFPVPIDLIKFRAIVGFYTRHRAYFTKAPLVPMPELLSRSGIAEEFCAACIDAEFNFQSYVNLPSSTQLKDPEQFRRSFEALVFQTAGLTSGTTVVKEEVAARTTVLEDDGAVVALRTRLEFMEEENFRKQEWIQKLESDNEKLRWDISSLSEVKDRWIDKLEGDINELRRDCISLAEDRDRNHGWAHKVEAQLAEITVDLHRTTQHKQTLLGELLKTKGELFRTLKRFDELSAEVARLVKFSPESFPLLLRPIVRTLGLLAKPRAPLALPAPEPLADMEVPPESTAEEQ